MLINILTIAGGLGLGYIFKLLIDLVIATSMGFINSKILKRETIKMYNHSNKQIQRQVKKGEKSK